MTVPFLAFAVVLQTRYFVPALPVFAALLAGGIVTLAGAQRGAWLGAAVLALWAIAFALPIARTLIADPASLHVTEIDRLNFFRYTSNAWGAREALWDLAGTGERVDGRVPLVGAMHYCTLPNLYITGGVRLDVPGRAPLVFAADANARRCLRVARADRRGAAPPVHSTC